ncbi:MAG: protein kinase [Myxococcota bacterium]
MSDVGAPRPGLVVAGRYQLGKLLGEGRTGRVYRAHDTQSTERVAVKLLRKPLCMVPDVVRRFAREFEMTSEIEHPNVVRSLAFGQELDGELAGTHYLVMELLDGQRLGDV